MYSRLVRSLKIAVSIDGISELLSLGDKVTLELGLLGAFLSVRIGLGGDVPVEDLLPTLDVFALLSALLDLLNETAQARRGASSPIPCTSRCK